jgi:ligand-binding sensor domain-containing protein/signal transduction histidine kinase
VGHQAGLATLFSVVLAWCACAFALNADRDIHQLAHRAWGEKDGYPGNALALAQTTDGFLWIGSDTGLFRFDGVHFERYQPSSGDQLPGIAVQSLLALPDGSLWIAYGTYGYENEICLLRNGDVKCYSRTDGVVSIPTAIVRDHEGTIWANTETGLIRFNGTRWEHIGRDWNFPEDVPTKTSTVLFVDSHGTLWAGVNRTALYLKQGSRRFEPTGAFAGYSTSVAEAPDGTIWLADSDSYIRAINKSVSVKSAAVARCEALTTPAETAAKCPNNDPLVVRIFAANDLFFDRNGSLWITTDSYGIVRVPHPERLRKGPLSKTSDALQIFSSKDGLSADHCIPALEDREGNIWVATRDGLDQFRDTALVPVALPGWVIQSVIAPADGGGIWVVGSYSYVGRIRGDSSHISFTPFEAFKPYRDPAGLTWIMSNSLGEWRDGRFQKLAQSPSSVAGSFGYWQVAGDRTGTLWAFADDYGFFSWDNHRWKSWATPAEVAKQHVADMFSDSTGLIWVSTYEGHVITMDQGKIVNYSLKPDRPLRYVAAFAEHAPHEIWAGGAGGLVLIDKGQFRVIRPAALDSLEDVTGIVDAGSGGLWLAATGGVIHVSRDEAERALRDPSYRFQGERFDSFDGLPGQIQAEAPFPKAVEGTDGRIWFTATRGLAWVDPKETPRRNIVPPPVHIERIVADGKAYEASKELRLAPHVRDLSIDYTALSFVAPEKIHFRYKLEGQDPDWREVVNDRQVQYSNLAPRHYTFRVMACNNSGVWNEAGAALEFSVLPAYYQTTWFRFLCVAAFLGLLWALYQLRLQQMQRRFAFGLEARVGERLRIARELHDTLLQSFQGVAFQLQAARKLILRKANNAEEVLDDAILATEEAIREGRSAIRDLRPEPAAQHSLSELLDAAGRELATAHELNGQAPSYRVLVEGKQQDLSQMLQDEVYRISREVIRNAFAHAAASHIEVEIRYDQDQLRLRVRDDGKGIDPKVLASGQSGHFGIPGMRERAQRIGAHLGFWSELGAGAEVELTVPAAMAYQKRHNGHRFGLFQRAGRDEQRS